jgi:hypothetical protein
LKLEYLEIRGTSGNPSNSMNPRSFRREEESSLKIGRILDGEKAKITSMA